MNEEFRVIISGGGTGGHIFPAVSIANAISTKYPKTKILFVGAEGRMEMQRVPAAGYKIKGLPIKGFNRANKLKNISVLCKLWKSLRLARKIIKDFNPQVAVGVGGYASGATLYECSKMGIPCVAYEGMERFFPADKIIMTGNPVRQNVLKTPLSQEEARKQFGLNPTKKTILLVGGSLGARTINRAVLEHLDLIDVSDAQFIWQTGKYYHQTILDQIKGKELPNLKIMDFIGDMGAAYKAADLVISRAGASSISEFQLIGKPVILVPSPNVAEDHQTKNAMALVNKGAALFVKDIEAPNALLQLAIKTVNDEQKLESLSQNVKKMGLHNSADVIADEVIKLIKQ